MIRLKALSKRFGRQEVLRGITTEVHSGESVALWGINGAGKTTVLRCICGLYSYQGSITVDGLDAARQGKLVRQRIGYVPQEAGLFPDMPVAEVIQFFARLRGVDVGDTEQRLAEVGLEDQGGKRVRECSGGMKQRLSLATAMLGRPGVLLLDEVTASLDAVGRAELVGLLSKLAKEREGDQGRTLLFASHRVEEIAALATRVLVLTGGLVEKDLSAAEFVDTYACQSVLHLLMDLSAASTAVQMLATRGFTARINGQGILVQVGVGNRMEPIRILQEGRVPIRDFEVLPLGSLGGE